MFRIAGIIICIGMVLSVRVAMAAGLALEADQATLPATTRAQTAPAGGDAAALPDGPFRAEIVRVVGLVQVRDSAEAPWKSAQVGMSVGEGAEFRTGPRSAVMCQLPNQIVTLDRLGTIKLMQAVKEGNVIKTRVGMTYGRTRYDVEAAGVEHQSELVSPSSTLAIRGTQVSIFDQPPFAPRAVSLTGRAMYETAKRRIAFGGKGQGKTEVSSDTGTAADTALLRTFVDPVSYFGRPKEDQKLLNQLQSKGDLLLNNGTLAVAFGGPVTDPQLQNIIQGQGRFNIALRWDSPGDFDLFVLTPDLSGKTQGFSLGNPSYDGSVFKDIGVFGGNDAKTLSRTPDGGRIKFDQVALGGGGFELASWNTPVPQVGYQVAVVYYDQRGRIANYPVRSDFRVDAFLDGKRVPVLVNLTEVIAGREGDLRSGPTYSGTASLLPTEQLLRVSQGDVRLTAIDLSVGAVGPINPATVKETAPAKVNATGARAGSPAARSSPARRR
jgi:hypothetical protein